MTMTKSTPKKNVAFLKGMMIVFLVITTFLPWFYVHNPSSSTNNNHPTTTRTTNSLASGWRMPATNDLIQDHLHQQQQEQEQEPLEANNETDDDDDSSFVYHFLISSGCSPYQRWQALIQMYSALSVSQTGKYTWIVSGCPDTPEEAQRNLKYGDGSHDPILSKQDILETIRRHFNNDNDSHNQTTTNYSLPFINVHFTPDFSDMSVYGGPYANGTKRRVYVAPNGKEQPSNFGNKYHFNNKPNGLHHWAKEYYRNNHIPMDTPTNTTHQPMLFHEAIVLIDPDFLFLRKFSIQETTRISPGKPAAAKYGLGGQWLTFNRTAICEGSHSTNPDCYTVSNRDINNHYNVGPPYILHIQDVYRFSKRWSEFVPSMYDEYPLLYAEMYAYSAAAVDLQLKHTLIHQDLYTGCMTAWPKAKEDKNYSSSAAALVVASALAYQQQQHPPTNTTTTTTTASLPASSCFIQPYSPPCFLHYCLRYSYKNPSHANDHTKKEQPTYYYMAKRKVPMNVLDCEEDGYLQPFESFADNEKNNYGSEDWNVLSACSILRAINYAKYSSCVKQSKQ